MKKIPFLLAGLVLIAAWPIQAQQPFEQYGYTAKVATLSQGKYEEFFDQDTVVQIGSVIMNRLTGKIVAFVEYETKYSEATLEPEIISRWLSPDPHAENYYSLSPYNFVANNPILFVDPDGRDIAVSFANSQAREAFLQIVNMGLEGQFTASLTAVDGQDGVFSLGFDAVDGGSFDNLSEQGQAFHTAISGVINSDVTTNLEAVFGDDHVQVGQFLTGKIDVADIQQFNRTGPEVEETVGATQIGKLTHETIEQFEKARFGVPQGSMDGFELAHGTAIEAENAVNLNTRGKTFGSLRDYTIPFTDRSGRTVHVRTQTRNQFGGRRRVVKVTQPKPRGKRRSQ